MGKIVREFGGIKLFNLSIDQLISWIEAILQHYEPGSTISKKMHALIEATQIKIRCQGNPLNKNYTTLGLLVMDRWVKAVWERAFHYEFTITLDYPVQTHPHARGQDLTDIFLEKNKSGKELLCLTRCRISHQAMYLSCIATAEGKHPDKTYLFLLQRMECLSVWQFAQEEPTPYDWKLWENFWQEYCSHYLELPALS
jgi:hypothetical protein